MSTEEDFRFASQEGVDDFDYEELAEEDITARLSVTFAVRNAEGGTTPHALEIVTNGKHALVDAMIEIRKLAKHRWGVDL